MICKNNTILNKNENKKTRLFVLPVFDGWMSVYYDTIEDGKSQKSRLLFSNYLDRRKQRSTSAAEQNTFWIKQMCLTSIYLASYFAY